MVSILDLCDLPSSPRTWRDSARSRRSRRMPQRGWRATSAPKGKGTYKQLTLSRAGAGNHSGPRADGLTRAAYWSSLSAVWALWLAWASMAVPDWTRMFQRASAVLSAATSTSMMRLLADSRLALLTVRTSVAKPRRLCSAPLLARNVATLWIASVMSLSWMPPSEVTPEAVRAPMPADEDARSLSLMATDDVPSSETETVSGTTFVPNRETPLNFSPVSEVSSDCSAVNSAS